MDTDPNAKVCSRCAERIKPAAKVCPFCSAPQTRFGAWRAYLGVSFSGVVLLAAVALACAALFPDAFRSEGRKFAPHRAELMVTQTSMERERSKPEFWLSGFITNTGNYPWRVRELEVRFFDARAIMVDVHRADIREPFVVQPHKECAFRVGIGRLLFTNSGISTRVRVSHATDGNLPSKPAE